MTNHPARRMYPGGSVVLVGDVAAVRAATLALLPQVDVARFDIFPTRRANGAGAGPIR